MTPGETTKKLKKYFRNWQWVEITVTMMRRTLKGLNDARKQ